MGMILVLKIVSFVAEVCCGTLVLHQMFTIARQTTSAEEWYQEFQVSIAQAPLDESDTMSPCMLLSVVIAHVLFLLVQGAFVVVFIICCASPPQPCQVASIQ